MHAAVVCKINAGDDEAIAVGDGAVSRKERSGILLRENRGQRDCATAFDDQRKNTNYCVAYENRRHAVKVRSRDRTQRMAAVSRAPLFCIFSDVE